MPAVITLTDKKRMMKSQIAAVSQVKILDKRDEKKFQLSTAISSKGLEYAKPVKRWGLEAGTASDHPLRDKPPTNKK